MTEDFLDRLGRTILQAIRNNTTGGKGGMNDAELDYVFGRGRQAAVREPVLQKLKGAGLIVASSLPGGARLWSANWPIIPDRTEDKKPAAKATTKKQREHAGT